MERARGNEPQRCKHCVQMSAPSAHLEAEPWCSPCAERKSRNIKTWSGALERTVCTSAAVCERIRHVNKAAVLPQNRPKRCWCRAPGVVEPERGADGIARRPHPVLVVELARHNLQRGGLLERRRHSSSASDHTAINDRKGAWPTRAGVGGINGERCTPGVRRMTISAMSGFGCSSWSSRVITWVAEDSSRLRQLTTRLSCRAQTMVKVLDEKAAPQSPREFYGRHGSCTPRIHQSTPAEACLIAPYRGASDWELIKASRRRNRSKGSALKVLVERHRVPVTRTMGNLISPSTTDACPTSTRMPATRCCRGPPSGPGTHLPATGSHFASFTSQTSICRAHGSERQNCGCLWVAPQSRVSFQHNNMREGERSHSMAATAGGDAKRASSSSVTA